MGSYMLGRADFIATYTEGGLRDQYYKNRWKKRFPYPINVRVIRWNKDTVYMNNGADKCEEETTAGNTRIALHTNTSGYGIEAALDRMNKGKDYGENQRIQMPA
jgi:hypothetical protein